MEYGIIAVILVLDQITKAVIQNSAAVKAGVEVIPDFFYLTYVQNTGAAWSMLSGHQVFLCLIAAAAICVMWVFMQKAKKEHLKLSKTALAMMIAGAAGNLIDRLMLNYVRDFLHFYPFGYDFPVFNVADCALTIGVILLIIGMLKGEGEEKHA
ncbi:signal peptidase II [Erysipelotrichaceae bacterium Oil+RF-744-GAM-WT-6]|jgi:signal peptidase II|uniref:Lipoprotein signal peptidase n=1 Tax=Stecheria intestinalis TaxID=2606630 RepID=A0A7X2NRH2_9FIRM|nr:MULTISPECIES: signal peptidase II [Erysipelotrichaceae]MCI2153690.1 signal peptidase II [Solobacterium sp.]MDY4681225.1 signal peptidase II [Lachnospiraceae bacterium]MCI6746079.1 signal peptidase II [Anaerolactibacter massiliensis]MDD5881861.1 signal peptidase II [Stecheria intestinalis]MDD6366287.1 signal peptidase II [Stecheria intestinalis]